MKIAVACEAGKTLLGPFRTDSDLSIWHVSDGKVTSREVLVPTGGCCGTLAALVRGVDLVLCRTIGHGAMNHLVEQGTQVASPRAAGLDAAEAVQRWLTGASEQFFVASQDCTHQSPCSGDHDHGHAH